MSGLDQFRARQAQRVELIRGLLEHDEEVIDAGLAQSVDLAARVGRGGGEGLLFLTNKRLLFRLDQDGSSAEVRLPNLSRLDTKRIAVPRMTRLVVQYRHGAVPFSASYYVGKRFAAGLKASVRRL
jgi:hypothetical protein